MIRRKRSIAALLVLVVICCAYAIFVTTHSDFENVGYSNGRMEFISGENVGMDRTGQLSLSMDTFRKVGETQYFSMTFKNNNSFQSVTTINLDYPNDYFSANYDKELIIDAGETKTYCFSITFKKAPDNESEFDFSMNLDTEYKYP